MKSNTEKELLLKLHDKIDEIKDGMKSIEIVQVKQNSALEEHIRRTEIAENRLDVIESEVKPILEGLSFLKIIAKVGASIASLAYGALKFFQ